MSNQTKSKSAYLEIIHCLNLSEVENRGGDTELIALARKLADLPVDSDDRIYYIGAIKELLRNWPSLNDQKSNRAVDFIMRSKIDISELFGEAKRALRLLKEDDSVNLRSEMYRLLFGIGWWPNEEFFQDEVVKSNRPGVWFDGAWKTSPQRAMEELPRLNENKRFEVQLLGRLPAIQQTASAEELKRLAIWCTNLSMNRVSNALGAVSHLQNKQHNSSSVENYQKDLNLFVAKIPYYDTPHAKVKRPNIKKNMEPAYA